MILTRKLKIGSVLYRLVIFKLTTVLLIGCVSSERYHSQLYSAATTLSSKASKELGFDSFNDEYLLLQPVIWNEKEYYLIVWNYELYRQIEGHFELNSLSDYDEYMISLLKQGLPLKVNDTIMNDLKYNIFDPEKIIKKHSEVRKLRKKYFDEYGIFKEKLFSTDFPEAKYLDFMAIMLANYKVFITCDEGIFSLSSRPTVI